MPERSCVVCKGRDEKGKLIRVVYRGGTLIVDWKQEKEGRGAYLHRSERCVRGAVRKPRIWRKALRIEEGKGLLKMLGDMAEEIIEAGRLKNLFNG